jgi:tight adherence protein B
METYIILGIIFVVLILVGWGMLVHGHAWFAQRTRRVATEVESNLADLFIFINTRQVAGLSALAVFVLPLAVWLVSGNVLFAAVSVPFALMMPRLWVRRMRTRRLREIEEQLPDALLMISSALRAGASFPMALESVAQESRPPVSQEFDLLLREIRLGVDLMVALQHMERRIPIPDFLMVTAAISISREVGGNLAETLESVARTLREKQQMEGKIRSLTAQGRMQGWVMTGLPVFLIFVLRHMEPKAMAPLFDSPMGWAVLAVIGTMEFIGYQAIKKITHIDV